MLEKRENIEKTKEIRICISKRGQGSFNGNVDFHDTLRLRVDDYFQQTGRPRRGNWQIYLKAVILLSCFFSSYLGLVFLARNLWEGLLSAVVLALSMTGIGFNIMHDGGHHAFSEHLGINKLAAMTLDLIGVSSYVWHWKHAMYHHNYVNIVGYDPDIDVSCSRPVCATSEEALVPSLATPVHVGCFMPSSLQNSTCSPIF